MKHTTALFSAMLVAFFAITSSASAVTVSSQDCSAIDTKDGDTQDWGDIPYLVNEDTSPVTGTLYYYDEDASEWTTTEPDNYQYTVNLDKWADIRSMKTCNTADDFFMMMEGGWPMFSYFDNDNDVYVAADRSPQGNDESERPSDLPEDWNYWMVWKMQKADGEGGILYFAADIGVDSEMSEFSDENVDHPKLYLYEESDVDAAYDDVAFDAETDTLLTKVEVSDRSGGEGEQGEGEEEFESDDAEAMAFEVTQRITQLFNNADFTFGDTINMSVAMYDESLFGTSAAGFSGAAVDDSGSGSYKISKNGVRSLQELNDSVDADSIRLTWKTFKSNGKKARSYQINVYNADTDDLVAAIRGVKKNKRTITGLDPEQSYRAIVRAVKRGKFNSSQQRLSSWSSGFRWTTLAQ